MKAAWLFWLTDIWEHIIKALFPLFNLNVLLIWALLYSEFVLIQKHEKGSWSIHAVVSFELCTTYSCVIKAAVNKSLALSKTSGWSPFSNGHNKRPSWTIDKKAKSDFWCKKKDTRWKKLCMWRSVMRELKKSAETETGRFLYDVLLHLCNKETDLVQIAI